MPKVTVLMPVYNVGPWVEDAVKSVLNQTFKDFVLLVMDDCSTDNTAEVVKSFSDNRIHYERNEHNLGLAENLNKGIELSDTEFIARMDGDDIAMPFWLEKEYEVMRNHPEIDVCGGGFEFFGTKDSVVIYPEKHDDIKAQMLFGCAIIVPMLRRRSIIENGLRYKASAFPAEDYMMWVECSQKLRLHNVGEVLFNYRMHSSQISTSKRASQIVKTDEARLALFNTLSSDFIDEQREYYLRKFVPAIIDGKQGADEMRRFADLLLLKNIGSFSHEALKRKLYGHISVAVYCYVIEAYFRDGYNLIGLFRVIRSGLWGYMDSKYRRKIFVKSIIFRCH